MSIGVLFIFFFMSCIAVPQQQSSIFIGPSQQIVSKQETEAKIKVVKPSDSDEGHSQASHNEDSTKTCSAKETEQQKESEVVGSSISSIAGS